MSDPRTDLDRRLGAYAAEVVRWNRQINLVSRQDSARRVDELVSQCRIAGAVLGDEILGDWDTVEPTAYFDLGSGGGLPGIVWHLLFGERFPALCTTLVEPREKRAWFLERQAVLAPGRPLAVHCGRWGEGPGPAVGTPAPGQILISLKALHLPDPVVLQGLEPAPGSAALAAGARIVIARFYPPEQTWTDVLAGDLGAVGSRHETDDYIYRAVERRVVGPGAGGTASLVISSYEAALKRP